MAASGMAMTAELVAMLAVELRGGQTLKVRAAAGAGKSTALRLYAAQHADLKILHLTFTKAEASIKQEEYRAGALSHVRVSTLHALAFEATSDLHFGRVVNDLHVSASCLASLTQTRGTAWPLARRTAVVCLLNRFAASAAPEPDEQLLEGTQDRGLLPAVRALWDAACDPDSSIPLTHDLYLKACLVCERRRTAMLGACDLALLDEAQDCTEAQLSLVESPSQRTWSSILVYDFRQRLYGWRNAASESYLRALPSISELPLSRSWRFSERVADITASMVSYHTNACGPASVTGNPEKATSVRVVMDLPLREVCGTGSRLVVVARTRRSLFDAAVAALSSPAVAKLSLAGTASIFEPFGGKAQLLDVFALSRRCAPHEMLLPSEGAARFVELGYEAFRSAKHNCADSEARAACILVDRYGSQVPELVRLLERAFGASSTHELLLLTVHEAKGGEWPFVYVHSDLQRSDHVCDEEQITYQLNLAYVAMTRATRILFVASSVFGLWLRPAKIVL